MHRRLFLRVAALGAASALSAGACFTGTGDSPEPHALAHLDLLDVLGDERVRAIGARYRAMVPDERDAPALRAAIHGRHPLLVWLLGTPRVAPAELVRRDFAEGRTVEVQGWVLSITEVRQAALYSLAPA